MFGYPCINEATTVGSPQWLSHTVWEGLFAGLSIITLPSMTSVSRSTLLMSSLSVCVEQELQLLLHLLASPLDLVMGDEERTKHTGRVDAEPQGRHNYPPILSLFAGSRSGHAYACHVLCHAGQIRLTFRVQGASGPVRCFTSSAIATACCQRYHDSIPPAKSRSLKEVLYSCLACKQLWVLAKGSSISFLLPSPEYLLPWLEPYCRALTILSCIAIRTSIALATTRPLVPYRPHSRCIGCQAVSHTWTMRGRYDRQPLIWAVDLSARLRLHEAEGASTLAVEMLNGASGGVGTVGAALPASASYIDKVRTSVRTLFPDSFLAERHSSTGQHNMCYLPFEPFLIINSTDPLAEARSLQMQAEKAALEACRDEWFALLRDVVAQESSLGLRPSPKQLFSTGTIAAD